jgi:hypothetical protein
LFAESPGFKYLIYFLVADASYDFSPDLCAFVEHPLVVPGPVTDVAAIVAVYAHVARLALGDEAATGTFVLHLLDACYRGKRISHGITTWVGHSALEADIDAVVFTRQYGSSSGTVATLLRLICALSRQSPTFESSYFSAHFWSFASISPFSLYGYPYSTNSMLDRVFDVLDHASLLDRYIEPGNSIAIIRNESSSPKGTPGEIPSTPLGVMVGHKRGFETMSPVSDDRPSKRTSSIDT